MATTKTSKTAKTTQSARTTAQKKSYDGFTAEEQAAMKEHAKDLKSKQDPAEAQAEKIAAMADADRVMAERLNELIPQIAPELTPKT
ncbi:hypothetical protein [Kribbella sp. NPDC048915]|uniref:hypothetical protein n=1 Tax=Kribbella sp. NPDC048915 TaxID=3155148 RepID=UPI00340CB3E5